MKCSGTGTVLQDPELDSVVHYTWEHRTSAIALKSIGNCSTQGNSGNRLALQAAHTDLELISFYALFPTLQNQ